MTAQEANQRLTSDLKQLAHDSEQLLEATAGHAGEKVKEIHGRLAKTLQSAKATREQVQGKATQAVMTADHVVREHPYESLGAAFGLGLLIGALAARR